MALSAAQTPQRSAVVGGGNALALAYASNISNGNLLASSSSQQGGGASGSSTADPTNGTWTQAVVMVTGDLGSRSSIDYFPNCAGGGTKPTVTVTYTGTASAQAIVLFIYEIAGAATSSPNVANNSATGRGTTLNGGNVTTTQNNSFILAHGIDSVETITGGSGFTFDGGGASFWQDGSQSKFPTSTGTYSGAFGNSGAFWGAIVSAFQEAAGAAPTSVKVPDVLIFT